MAVADLDQRGFVKVPCAACENPDVWLRCDGCQKSDHFLLSDGRASCSCGQSYDHARCLCDATVDGGALQFVPFKEGPMALADLEWSGGRLAIVGVLLVGLIAGVAWWLLS